MLPIAEFRRSYSCKLESQQCLVALANMFSRNLRFLVENLQPAGRFHCPLCAMAKTAKKAQMSKAAKTLGRC